MSLLTDFSGCTERLYCSVLVFTVNMLVNMHILHTSHVQMSCIAVEWARWNWWRWR